MVDCAGSCKVCVKLGSGETTTLTFHMCSMINSGTGWVKFGAVTSASGKNVSELVQKNGYLANQGQLNVTMTTALSLCVKNFKSFYPSILVIKSKPTTIKNSQAQALVERMHHRMANQLRVRVLEEDTWIEDTDFMMQHCAWFLRADDCTSKHAPCSWYLSI